jgi:hypothetical protein
MHLNDIINYFQAKKITDTIVGTAWWTWDKSNQLSMKIVGIRSSEPVQLKGGHLVLALTTVTAVRLVSNTNI